MSKKNSKGQRKKFFSHPKNKGRVFKRKELPRDGNAIRKRGNFSVLPTTGFKEVPSCSHGPCLLFGAKEGGVVTKRYFACAVYRNDPDSCDFKAEVDSKGEVTVPELKEPEEKKWNYGCIPKKLKTISKESPLVFCRECNDVFEKKHKCPSEFVTRKQLKHPSRFLEALDKQNGEAQFFFSDESLDVVLGMVEKSKVDGVLCVGSPRIFEALKLKGQSVFMLDIDRRYAHFYPSAQYAQYSMLVHHFYHDKAPERLMNFFSKCSSVLMVCDPPFGVFMEPLMESLKKLEKMHSEARTGAPSKFFSAILVPFFVGKHILRLDAAFWMSDYRVTYENHKGFDKPNKTTVRIFTNLPVPTLNLSDVPAYKFCEMCEKHVHESNKHCFMCQICPAKDGSQMRHCDRCSRCVKISYKHCRDCSRCHLQGRCFTAGQGEEDEHEE